MTLFYETIQKAEKHSKLLSIISALAAASFTVYCAKKVVDNIENKKEADNGYDKIPIPEGCYYYLGHLPTLRKSGVFMIPEWHKKYGPLLHVKMGVQDWIFIGDPQIAHDIFVSNGASTSGRPHTTFGYDIAGAGERGVVFADYGKNWKVARTAALNILSPSAVKGFREVLWRESGRCVAQLIEQTALHGEVDPLPYIRLSSVNIMLTVNYGIPTYNSPEDPFYKKIIDIVETSMKFIGPFEDISSFLPVMSFLDVLFRKEHKMRKFWYETGLPTFAKLVEDARKNGNESLTKRIDSIKDELGLDDQNVFVILSELLVAGSDTVSTATLWTYLLLCNYPEAQQKIIDEIDTFIKENKRPPTIEDRLSLPYYISAQKECLRYRPIAFVGLVHKATDDVIYKNYFIPKGTVLTSTVASLNYSEKHFTEPEKFIPERFLDNPKTIYAINNGNINSRDQFNFGWGRRLCPGIVLAENELFNNVTRLLTRCRIEPAKSPTGEDIFPDINSYVDKGAVVDPVKCKIRFVLREDRLMD